MRQEITDSFVFRLLSKGNENRVKQTKVSVLAFSNVCRFRFHAMY